MVQWRAEHSEQRKEAIGAWREGNAEHVRAYKRNWERTHRAQKALADHAQYDKDPLRGWARTLASKYGPEAVSAYHRLLREQDGKCAICRVSESRRKLDLDHDHATGMVRGLLCNSCNLGLGKFGDDPVRLEAAAEYLRRING
jgi:ferric-dicitrate binding protein FerR (iron transport regulator)